MRLTYPSPEFDDTVSAVCHGTADEALCRDLNELLRNNKNALDEYILRLELHSRLGSDEDLYFGQEENLSGRSDGAGTSAPHGGERAVAERWFSDWRIWSVAALFVLAAFGVWRFQASEDVRTPEVGSHAVAMLDRTVRAQWAVGNTKPLAGDSLDAGWLTLESGLAQIVLYKGARLIVEGPAEFQLLTPNHIAVRSGKLTADVPSQSSGFQIDAPHASVSGTVSNLGLDVSGGKSSVHVFTGEVSVQPRKSKEVELLASGIGIVVTDTGASNRIDSDGSAFASLYDLHAESSAALALRMDYWKVVGERLNRDPSMLVRFDFDQTGASRWDLPNLAAASTVADRAAIIGCQWGEGRWHGKRALEFQNVNDRVRVDVQDDYESLTLSAWVRVQGLDRELNSLFMSDGFAAKTIHWLIRDDGVLGMTVVGDEPGDYQIVASPPVLQLDSLGRWVHLAVVLDGSARRVTHYFNGREVDSEAILIKPPYRVGPSELGNWSAYGFPEDDPFMIRNFSGAMDEFCLFGRALGPDEIQSLYVDGRPDSFNLAALD